MWTPTIKWVSDFHIQNRDGGGHNQIASDTGGCLCVLRQWPWFLWRSGWMESGLIQDVNLVSHFGREVANEVFTAAETVGDGWF